MPRAAVATPARKRTTLPPAALRTPAPAPAPAPELVVLRSRDDLLRRFAPLVRHVVERVATTLPRTVDHEDLYSAGVLGLLDAHAKFDAKKGVKFETYAVWRIRGAVLDQLRSLDWVSRSMRRKARNLDGVTRKLDQKLGRAASEVELAREMNLSRGDFYRLLDQVRGAVLVSLDEPKGIAETSGYATGGMVAAPSVKTLIENIVSLYGILPGDWNGGLAPLEIASVPVPAAVPTPQFVSVSARHRQQEQRKGQPTRAGGQTAAAVRHTASHQLTRVTAHEANQLS